MGRVRDSFEDFFLRQVETFTNSLYLYVPSARFAVLAEHLPEAPRRRKYPLPDLCHKMKLSICCKAIGSKAKI